MGVDEASVRKFVGRCARPMSVAMSKYRSGRHIGKCYVAFESVKDAHCVMAELNGNLLRARPVVMEFANIDEEEMDVDEDEDEQKKKVGRGEGKDGKKPIR